MSANMIIPELSPLTRACSCACTTNNSTEIKRLIDTGADVNYMDSNGMTPLMMAAYHSNLEAVELLITTPGIELNKIDKYGNTALMFVGVNNRSLEVRTLTTALMIRFGADVSALNSDGDTYLDTHARWNKPF